MKTRGFNTRKMERLSDENRFLHMRIQRLEKTIASLVRTKERCKRNLAIINSSIEKLTPKLKCEEVKVMPFTEVEASTKKSILPF